MPQFIDLDEIVLNFGLDTIMFCCLLNDLLFNPCLHAGIVVLQQYRAGVNPPKLTLLYTIGTGSARATGWCHGQ